MGSPTGAQHTPQHTQFKVIVQEGKMADAFLACSAQTLGAHVEKVKMVDRNTARHA
jgi:hypothetical protein